MANTHQLAAQSRNEFGKGAARRTRRDGKVPAVIYGHGTDPVHVALPAHETQLVLRAANALLEISVDGAEALLALPKQVQRNPIRDNIEHVDLVLVRRGEKVAVDVPLSLLNADESGAKIVMLDIQSITLEVEATAIPAGIEIDVKHLEVGDTITAKEITLPEGAVYNGDPDALVVAVSAARAAVAEGEADAAEGDAADAAAGDSAE